ncbi:hypothetical protein BH11BAC7_BH11BAC7_34820 [soil metagenome]
MVRSTPYPRNAENKSPELLSGVIECDEMVISGLEKNKHAHKRTKGGVQGRSSKTKTILAGILHRR